MSWLFGYGKGSSQTPDLSQYGIPPPGEGGNAAAGGGGAAGGGSGDNSNLTKAEKKAMEAYRFDSTALERAAQAARELEKSSKLL